MKKVFSLLVICLLLTSCGNKKEEIVNKQEDVKQQENATNMGYSLVKKEDDNKSMYISDENINFNGTNVKDALNSGALKIDDIVSNMSYVTLDDDKSNMYIIEQDEESFYVMECDKDNNHNTYIGTDFDTVVDSCK